MTARNGKPFLLVLKGLSAPDKIMSASVDVAKPSVTSPELTPILTMSPALDLEIPTLPEPIMNPDSTTPDISMLDARQAIARRQAVEALQRLVQTPERSKKSANEQSAPWLNQQQWQAQSLLGNIATTTTTYTSGLGASSYLFHLGE